jgi:formamidopyrimidine-DNA glycosylase
VPELPDIESYLHAISSRAVGHRVTAVRVRGFSLLRTFDPPAQDLVGHVLLGVERLGKRLVFGFDGELYAVLHLMIAGRLRWSDEPGAPIPGKLGLAAIDFDCGTLILTEAGTKKRASLHVHRGRAALAEHDRGGLEPLQATYTDFERSLTCENRTVKRALTDPRRFSGIGNAFSDEILHRARLSPVKLTQKLSDGDKQRLYEATQTLLRAWVDKLIDELDGGWPEKVTAFRPDFAVHGRYEQPCPVCGSPVQRIRYANNETNYCATCQNEGKLLADRSLSRLLKDDWPRTLDELEGQ